MAFAAARAATKMATKAFQSSGGQKAMKWGSGAFTAYQFGTAGHQAYKGGQALHNGDGPGAASHFTRSILSASGGVMGVGSLITPAVGPSASMAVKLTTSAVRATTGATAVATPHLASGDHQRASTAALGGAVGGVLSGAIAGE